MYKPGPKGYLVIRLSGNWGFEIGVIFFTQFPYYQITFKYALFRHKSIDSFVLIE